MDRWRRAESARALWAPPHASLFFVGTTRQGSSPWGAGRPLGQSWEGALCASLGCRPAAFHDIMR